MSELAADGIPVAVTCRVLKLARQPYCRWLAAPVTDAEWIQAHRANALFDAHRDDPEFGYWFLVEEARDAGQPMVDRTAWRICSANRWWSVFGKKKPYGKARKPGAPAHEDVVAGKFTADAGRRALLHSGSGAARGRSQSDARDGRMRSRISGETGDRRATTVR